MKRRTPKPAGGSMRGTGIVRSIWTMSDQAMTSKWNAILRSLFAPPQDATLRTARDIGRFGIGFCPGCKRLRGAPSLRCGVMSEVS